MTNLPHVIETALLLLVAFLIGCLIGYFLRVILAGKITQSSQGNPHEIGTPTASTQTTSPNDATVQSVVQPASAAKPKAQPKPKVRAKTKPAVTEVKRATAATAPVSKSESKSAPRTVAKKSRSAAATAPRKANSAKRAPAASSAKNSASAEGKPTVLTAPRAGKKDDLKTIKGIGPKIEGILNELGIFHFDQIAAWDRAAIDWVDDYLSFKGRIDREKWVAQAKEFGQR